MSVDPAPLAFTCHTCGAQSTYAPGTTTLRCTKCGAQEQIDQGDETIDEHSYDAWAALPAKPVALLAQQVLECRNCGAKTETDQLSSTCRFCHGALVSVQNPEALIAPEAVVPFSVDKAGADKAFAAWVRSRRFAPSALKRVGTTDAIKGTYVPHWTYDADTQTDYTGEQGEHYWVTEVHTVSDGKGGSRVETRQVQHTRWRGASGHVSRSFDDVLVPASDQLPAERLDDMGPWTLGDAAPYQPEYLAGYAALRYDVAPDGGLTRAKGVMEKTIRTDCERDIGGDEQRVHTVDTRYAALMFKLVLLPLWIASYAYAGTSYQVFVNANTGEVVGDRPYSKVKIALAVLAVLVVVAAAIVLYVTYRK